MGVARSLASAASCGWGGAGDVLGLALRCGWTDDLLARVAALDAAETIELSAASRSIWEVFAHPARRADTLADLVRGAHLVVGGDARHPHLEIATLDGTAHELVLIAALGLLAVLSAHGPTALAVCDWRTCDQPVVRVGRRARSSTCSPVCANRVRVSRHRSTA